MEVAPVFTLNARLDNVVVVTIGVLGKKVNTLEAELASQVWAILKQIRGNKASRGVVFISARPNSFIAGVDINMIGSCHSAQEAEILTRQGQQMVAEINVLPIPVTVVIRGACPGGGLEMVLARHNHIRADDIKAVLGLPEIQLDLLPGSGGTQWLPRLIGVSTILGMILTGKQLYVKQALRVGLVDEVVSHFILLEAVVELVKKDSSAHRALSVRERVLAGSLRRALLFCMASKKTA